MSRFFNVFQENPVLNNLSSLSFEGQKLIERLDQLDFVDPFSLCYFNEIKAIEREIQEVKKKLLQ